MSNPSVDEKVSKLVEVTLNDEGNFLKVIETLTRIGIASFSKKTLWQSCHILQKRGKYYIVHFKELFGLDGRPCDMDESDYQRRNLIASLLEKWSLVKIVNPLNLEVDNIKALKLSIIKHADKADWTLLPKYSIGTKKRQEDTEA